MDPTEKKTNFLKSYLANHGLKMTQQRQLIAQTFFETDDHLSISELYTEIKKKRSNIGFATVYRTIKLFEECGLAVPRHFGHGEAKYEQDFEVKHHDHLICTGCGKIIEFHNRHIENLQDKIAQTHGFKLQHHHHNLYGECKNCQ